MNILSQYKKQHTAKVPKIMSLEEWLQKAQKDSTLYLSPAERLLRAIGEPEVINTSNNPRLGRIFGNRQLRTYKAFSQFYGLETVIERIVSFFRHAAQGLEESRQILYLLGPVGSAKSSLAETLKKLMESQPISVLCDHEGNFSPINESPLGLFNADDSEALKIPARFLNVLPSPWATKRKNEYNGDLAQFKVAIIHPSILNQIAVSKTEPGDENNQDISALVGKLDIRKLEFYSQNDPDAYNYAGGLGLAHQGILDFVEMFKAPIKVLNPLLTATQEKNYNGTESIGAIPFDGIILAHSNESEWHAFKTNKNNEAFLDRVYIVEVPYCLRVDDEIDIYKKLIRGSDIAESPCAPGTLEMLAEFAVISRLSREDGINLISKMQTYNGENVKSKDVNAKSLQEYRDLASRDEGFDGVSTRLAYKVLSEVYNFDPEEIAADPIHMLYILEKTIQNERFPSELETFYLSVLKGHSAKTYADRVHKDIQTAYLDSYDEYGQAIFDRYIKYADSWISENDYRDPDTGQMYDLELLEEELEKIEKPAKVHNTKDFRHEVVNYALRYQASHKGENPNWKAYEKLRRVIEETMFSKTDELLPIISFGGQGNSDSKKKHEQFINRMLDLGYTSRQAQRAVEWHMRWTKSN